MEDGDDFGHIDVVLASINFKLPIHGILEHTSLLKRNFTIQALSGLEMLQLDSKVIKQMHEEHPQAFN